MHIILLNVLLDQLGMNEMGTFRGFWVVIYGVSSKWTFFTFTFEVELLCSIKMKLQWCVVRLELPLLHDAEDKHVGESDLTYEK